MLEGCLELDFEGGRTVKLHPGEAIVVPAGVRHRSRSQGRCVNLCFEHMAAYTDAVFENLDCAHG